MGGNAHSGTVHSSRELALHFILFTQGVIWCDEHSWVGDQSEWDERLLTSSQNGDTQVRDFVLFIRYVKQE